MVLGSGRHGMTGVLRKQTQIPPASALGACSAPSTSEECDHARGKPRLDAGQAGPLEQGQTDGLQATAAPKARLVHPHEAPSRGSSPGLGGVQLCERQQAARLRRRRGEGRRRCTKRICPPSGYGAPTEDGPAGPVRIARAHPPSDRRLPASGQSQVGRVPIPGPPRAGQGMTTRQYARLVSEWVASIGLDPRLFGTHSLRRTKATLIYRRTGNLRAVQLLLGHTKIESNVRYLGIEVDDALAIAEQVGVWNRGRSGHALPLR